jgi:YhcH/YjgK/YiaL family protein
MIVDRLGSPALAALDHPRLRRALDYLSSTDVRSLTPGRHELDGDRLFALVQDFATRPPEACRWESHRQYIDVQFVADGVERMGWIPVARARELEPYDAARDVAFYAAGGDFITLEAGMLAIFWPTDVHAPCCSPAGAEPRQVRKVVVKVRVE